MPSLRGTSRLNHLRVACSTIALLFAVEAVAAAQEPTTSLASVVTTGQRVRVRSITEPHPVVGGVSAVDIDFLTVIPDGLSLIKIPASSITTVDASRGRTRNWRKGLVVGLAVGVGLGFAFPVDAANCGPETPNFCSRGQALTGGTVVFGGIGAGVGAFIKSERWTPLDTGRPSR
jgi:hypothetical protein